MNIFYLANCVKTSARYHCDKHVVKMILECAQLLCSVHHSKRNDMERYVWPPIPYKKTHAKHPCSLWAQDSKENYRYLCKFGLALCEEYTFRYGKIHKSQRVIEQCMRLEPIELGDKCFVDPPQCMPDEYKCEDTVEAYRRYYRGDKKRFAKWKKRDIPEWFV